MQSAVIIHNVVKMHAQPNGDSEQVSQTLLGHTVSVLESAEGWLRIQTDDQYEGWVRAAQLRLLAENEAYPPQGQVVRVNALWSFVREQPDPNAPHLTIAPMGAWLEGHEWYGDWLQVRLPDARSGWVAAQDVTSQWVMVARAGALRVEGAVISRGQTVEPYRVPRSGWQNALVYTAKRLLGVPYLWEVALHSGWTVRGSCSWYTGCAGWSCRATPTCKQRSPVWWKLLCQNISGATLSSSPAVTTPTSAPSHTWGW